MYVLLYIQNCKKVLDLGFPMSEYPQQSVYSEMQKHVDNDCDDDR